MGAIKKYTGEESEAVLAVNAGNDILLTSDHHIHLDAVIKAAKSGKIKEEIINKACRRIIAWKFQYLNATEAIPDEDGEKGEEPGSKTLIVVVSILVGVIVVGCIIVLIMFLKKKNNNNITDDVKNIDGDVLIEN